MAAFAILFSGMFSACSSDSLIDDAPDQPVDRDSEYYIKVDIANPSGNDTRAVDTNNDNPDNYVNGTEAENKIHKITFIFYNSAMQYVGVHTHEVKDATNPGGNQTNPGTVETIMSVTVPVSVSAGSLKPAYVVAYVNPTIVGNNDLQSSYENTLRLLRTLSDVTPQTENTAAGIKAHEGFSMNNSVYYDGAASSKPVIAVPISEDQLCSTQDEANEAVLPSENTGGTKKKEKVVIYVERVVAKVTVNKAQTITTTNNKITDADGTEYTLTFTPLAWGLSNLEKTTFLLKNFRSGSNNYTSDNRPALENMTYTDANTRFSDLKDPSWNYPAAAGTMTDGNWPISGRRSFWAMSPTYFSGAAYPPVADNITHVEGANYPLEYVTFNQIYNSTTNGPSSKGANFGEMLYTLEHTTQPTVVTNQQKKGVTCALIVGKYSFANAADGTPAYKTFYIGTGSVDEGKAINTFYAGDKQLKTAFLSHNTAIYTRSGAGSTADPYKYTPVAQNLSDATLAHFEIIHPTDTELLGGHYIANRYITVQLKTAPAGTYFLRTGTDTFQEIGSAAGNASIKDANKQLYACYGPMGSVSEYEGGLAYFAVPIKHLWYRSSPGIGEAGFTGRRGQYGIVRNHSYSLKVTKIDGIGTGIGDPSAPIVPVVDSEKYYISAEMRVQRWRVVPEQEVTLKP